MSSLTAGAHFRWIVEEEEERRAREEGDAIRGNNNNKRVHWNSSVQVRSISPRRLKVGGVLGPPPGGLGPPPGSRPPVGLFSGCKKLEEQNKKEKVKTLGTLRMLSQSTKALVGQVQSKESYLLLWTFYMWAFECECEC